MTQSNDVLQPDRPRAPAAGEDRFGKRFKSWREWNTAFNFLTNLDITVNPGLIRSSTEDPPDVTYGRASFEIKEILDAGRLRHQEAKTGRYAAAPLIAAPLTPLDIATEVFDRLQEAHTHYAPEVKAQTDFLCYVNLRWRHFEQGPLPQPTLFDKFGWRSVSAVVQANESLVFYANAEAPEFLQKRAGLVCSRGYAPV